MSLRAIRAGRAEVEVGVRDRLKKDLAKAHQRLKRFANSVNALGRKMATVATPLAAGLGFATKIFAGFDDQMRLVAAVTGATDREFKTLTDTAAKLGRTTSFTASQVATAMVDLGRAGFNTSEINESIGSILNLSRATGTELSQSAQIAADTLRAFKLESSDMSRVVDTLTAAANGSSQTLVDLFEALKLVAPLAASTGDSIEDVSTQVGLLANAGIKGSMAGTALKKAYLNLSDPKIQATLKNLGVDATDGAGNLRKLQDILADVGRATNNFGTAEGLAAFNKLFGARGLVAAENLAKAGSKFDELNRKIKEGGGIAAATAKRMDAGIGGFIRLTLSALEGVAIAVGDAVAPIFNAMRDAIGGALEKIAAFIGRNKALVMTITAAVGAALLLSGGLFILGSVANVVMFAIGGLSAMLTLLGTVAGIAAGLLTSPWLLIPAAIGGVVAAFVMLTDTGSAMFESVKGFFGGIFDIVKTTVGGVYNALVEGNIAKAGKIAFTGLKLVIAETMDSIASIFGASIDDMLRQLVNLVAKFKEIKLIFQTAIRGGVKTLAENAAPFFGDIGVDTKREDQQWQQQLDKQMNELDRWRREAAKNLASAFDIDALKEELKNLTAVVPKPGEDGFIGPMQPADGVAVANDKGADVRSEAFAKDLPGEAFKALDIEGIKQAINDTVTGTFSTQAAGRIAATIGPQEKIQQNTAKMVTQLDNINNSIKDIEGNDYK